MRETLETLRRRFPDARFLALGQTALWDEPTKASLLWWLARQWPEASLTAAAHDTDYFAKLPGHPAAAGENPFAMVGHDDARTRGLWSAAGEMSRLFGSEDVVTRTQLRQEGGVSLHKALSFVDQPDTLLSEWTAAWGWTGIIQAGWERSVVASIRLAAILPTLLAQIDWATGGSAHCLTGERQISAQQVGRTLRGWVETFAQSHPDASLADLYRDLLPRLYTLLLGATPQNLLTSQTTELLRLNRATANLPRFTFAALFLRPETRAAARRAYDEAVDGSDIYPLEKFGEGATPFDVAVPGHGRGTLCIVDGAVSIDTPEKIRLITPRRIASIAELAELLEERLGPQCTLVGKAIALLPMLAAEYVFVFHEGASAYSERTRQMIRNLAARQVPLPPLHPILRLRYRTWDALAAVPDGETVAFDLPDHLRQAFGRPTISLTDFADCWQRAAGWETERLTELARHRSPRALLAYLGRNAPRWREHEAAYDQATKALLDLRAAGKRLQDQVKENYATVRTLRAEIVALELARGEDFRARGGTVDDDGHADRQRRFDLPAALKRAQVHQILGEIRRAKATRLALERGEASASARATLRRIEAEIERERARIAHNALQTIHGLRHTQFRPSAWWFPLVDPSGAWFQRVAETAEPYLESLAP